MIKKIKIKNFKKLDELQLDNLTKINIIGGENNTGKTSFLESLFLFFDLLNPNAIIKQLVWRGTKGFELTKDSVWLPIFKEFDISKNIEIELDSYNECSEKLKIKHNKEFKKKIFSQQLTFDGAENITEPISITESLDFEYIKDKKTEALVHSMIDYGKVEFNIEKTTSSLKRAAFIHDSSQNNLNELANAFGKIEVLSQTKEIVNFLKIIEPKLKSLTTIALGNQSMIYGDIDLKRKVPIQYMGGGTVKLLSILLHIANVEGGAIFIDEIENGFHYSVQQGIWRTIHKAATKYNCQVFVTTHSYEVIKNLLPILTKKNQKDFSYIRFEKKNNMINTKQYESDMLQTAIERSWEVR